jgi:chemotaxis family two-component system sensor kinase Cph1
LLLALKEHVQASPESGVVATDHSASWFPAMSGCANIASGVLALPLRDEQRTTLFWFRPGVTETVVWAGDPRKSIQEDKARILPRRSFERWTEQRSGYSEPWSLGDIETATALGFAIDEMILRHGRKIKALNARLMQAERETAEHDLVGVTLRAALEERDAQLARKDFLLREVDHRVRNSLALISSMLQLQARSTPDLNVREQFLEASRRVVTVGHVHQRLYQTGELRSLDFGDYLRALTADLSASAGGDANRRLVLETTPVTLGADIVIPLGLIVNELVTNAFKHGGKSERPLTVNVSFAQDAAAMRLVVEDDGDGLPQDFDPRLSKGLGMRLVNGLIGQLNARLEHGGGDKGARFAIVIPVKQNGSGLPAG